ncbi:hypothetical protein BACCOP_00887 [Phocaeicola coprocola DSM 17136]|uniref:Uncharacterized protein n=1 Tax=Phocaeicola coprocola DSM 17136 TaxID=470145 RepID=B3JG85_9BACT|nr:hypothetical protein BACCOP_00887 [Phocaeicola coprocola DSM 17136]
MTKTSSSFFIFCTKDGDFRTKKRVNMLMFFEYVQMYFLHRFNQFDFLPFMLS